MTIVPSVVMNGGTFRTATTVPLMSPTRTPTATAARTQRITGRYGRSGYIRLE
jgi:hypothetical protein